MLKKLRYLFILLLDSFVGLLIKKSEPTGVVVVRLDAIGDFVIWLDAAKEYRKIYPNKKITLIGNSQWSVLAKNFSYWDEVWPLNVGRFTDDIGYRLAFMRKIRRAGFDVAINPSFSRVILFGDSVVRATQATIRIGSVGDSSNVKHKKITNFWYTQLLPAVDTPLMELHRNAEFISHLKSAPYVAEMPCIPELCTLPSTLSLAGDYFIIFPGASWLGRKWPIERFSVVLKNIQQQYGWRPVLCGSPADVELCAAIKAVAGVPCINLAGQTSLEELAEIIRRARLLISNETSAVHFAAAVQTPSVCILGGGHYGRFMPYPVELAGVQPVMAVERMPCFHCNWICTKEYDPMGAVPCIDAVSVELVLKATAKALEQPRLFIQR